MYQQNSQHSQKTDPLARSWLAQAITTGVIAPLAAVRSATCPVVAYWLEFSLIFAVVVVGVNSKCLPIRRWSQTVDSAVYYFLLVSLSWVIGYFGYAYISWGTEYGFVNFDPKGFVPWHIA